MPVLKRLHVNWKLSQPTIARTLPLHVIKGHNILIDPRIKNLLKFKSTDQASSYTQGYIKLNHHVGGEGHKTLP